MSLYRIVVVLKVMQYSFDSARAFKNAKSELSLIGFFQRRDEKICKSFNRREESSNPVCKNLGEGADARLLFRRKPTMARKSDRGPIFGAGLSRCTAY